MASLSFAMDSVVDSSVILRAANFRRPSFPLCKSAGNLSFCRSCRTTRKLAIKRVNAASSGSGDADDSEDALQATIEKSKKVLEMQRNLLDQIKERKKLVSSMKSSIINNEDDDDDDSIDEVKENWPIDGGDVKAPGKDLLSKGSYSSASSARQLNDVNEVDSNDEGSAQMESSTSSYSNNSLNLDANRKLKDAPGKKIESDVSFSMFEYNANLPLRDENRERVVGEPSPQIGTAKDDPMREDAKPPPLAGANVMNIIMVAAECAPFVKTGGLADVAGALPKALARRGHRVMVVVPRYNDYANAQNTGVQKMYRIDGQDMEVNYFQTFIDGVDFVFIDSPIFRHIENNIYGGKREDILKRMVLFCKAAVEVPWHVPCGGICYGDGNLVFIANDWHTALLPVYLKAYYRDHGLMQYTRSVLVIHNMAHQGRGPVSDFSFTDLPPHYLDLFKFYDPLGGEHFNIFAAGIKMADRIVTVSHGYAWEVKTPEGGWGLHGVINENDWKLTGIVNGIDTDDWHPEVDIHLQSDGYSNYSLDTLKTGKPRCKKALQKELSLPVREHVPLIGFIGRLDDQKGVDLIAEAVPWMMDQDVQLVMLGTGRADLEEMLRHFEGRYNDSVRGWVGFSVQTAHRITAGADILLMPSRFEPCGLNQLYAMTYGTVPVVHAVGGLRDTVQPFNPYEESGLGWTFDRADVSQLIHALGNCLYTYREYKNSWEGIQRRGMMQNLSWDTAAEKYEEVLVAAKYQW